MTEGGSLLVLREGGGIITREPCGEVTLEVLQRLVGGYVEARTVWLGGPEGPRAFRLYFDEEGAWKQRPQTMRLPVTRTPIVGDVVVCLPSESGEDDLPIPPESLVWVTQALMVLLN